MFALCVCERSARTLVCVAVCVCVSCKCGCGCEHVVACQCRLVVFVGTLKEQVVSVGTLKLASLSLFFFCCYMQAALARMCAYACKRWPFSKPCFSACLVLFFSSGQCGLSAQVIVHPVISGVMMRKNGGLLI